MDRLCESTDGSADTGTFKTTCSHVLTDEERARGEVVVTIGWAGENPVNYGFAYGALPVINSTR